MTLADLFIAVAQSHPHRPALAIGDATTTYGDLLGRARGLAAAILDVDAATPLCALYARRSLWAYAGVLGILLSGRGYVPLSPAYPPERTRRMLALSGASIIVADAVQAGPLGEVVGAIERPLTVLLPGCLSPPSWAGPDSRHAVLCRDHLRPDGRSLAVPVGPDDTAYLLFTSGSSGAPKGVGISNRNAVAYLSGIREILDLGPEDRVSQNFEMTFDLSVHDMFAGWGAGACLCVPLSGTAITPASFVRRHGLTSWFSTPSAASVLVRLRALRPGAFPTLRWSLFCGEPLPLRLAEVWQAAAPLSTLVNLYGPTEATIACTAYVYRKDTSPPECANGLVPIGRPFGSTRTAVVSDHGDAATDGREGELVLSGDQVARGYWQDPPRSAGAFVSLPGLGSPGPWYRTGDLVTANGRGNLVYRGRKDHQMKIMGHRVELQEIEHVARETAAARQAVALGWPPTASGAEGIILYLSGAQAADEVILAGFRSRLPPYMVPREIHRLEEMPLNASGKIDRQTLLAMRERTTWM